MRRIHHLRRQSRRAAWLGLGLSVIVHAAVLAIARFDGLDLPSSPRKSDAETAVLDDAEEPDTPEFMRVLAIRPAPIEPAREAGNIASPPAAAETPPAAPATSTPPAGRVEVPAPAEPRPSIDPPTAPDPLPVELGVSPIVIADLAVPETTAVESEADEEPAERPAYVPGSIGKAKRQWADDGESESDQDRGMGWGASVGRGGDRCPMPRGGRGPLWFGAR